MKRISLLKLCLLGPITFMLFLSWVGWSWTRCDTNNQSTLISLYLSWESPAIPGRFS